MLYESKPLDPQPWLRNVLLLVWAANQGCAVCQSSLDELCDGSMECGPLTERYTDLDSGRDPTVFECDGVLILEYIDRDTTSYWYYREEDRSLLGVVYKDTGFCRTSAYGEVDRSMCRDSDCVCEHADVVYRALP